MDIQATFESYIHNYVTTVFINKVWITGADYSPHLLSSVWYGLVELMTAQAAPTIMITIIVTQSGPVLEAYMQVAAAGGQ